MRPRNASCSQQCHTLKVLVNEWVMDRRPVHASCDITSKKEKKIPVCHGSQSWSLLAGGYETLWFEIWEAQSSLARWAGWISGKDGGWVQVKKKRHYFFLPDLALNWLSKPSRTIFQSCSSWGSSITKTSVISQCISNLLFPTHKHTFYLSQTPQTVSV